MVNVLNPRNPKLSKFRKRPREDQSQEIITVWIKLLYLTKINTFLGISELKR